MKFALLGECRLLGRTPSSNLWVDTRTLEICPVLTSCQMAKFNVWAIHGILTLPITDLKCFECLSLTPLKHFLLINPNAEAKLHSVEMKWIVIC